MESVLAGITGAVVVCLLGGMLVSATHSVDADKARHVVACMAQEMDTLTSTSTEKQTFCLELAGFSIKD